MDNLTKGQRRKNMQNIRSIGTKPEKMLAKALRKRGIYFAQNVKTLPGKPDFVFRKKKVAVFVDSDFWHGHPKKFIMPETNKRYWKKKISDNKKRDRMVSQKLQNDGWKVLRFWEHEVGKSIEKCLHSILKTIGRN